MADAYDEEFSSQHSTISGYASQTSLYATAVIFTMIACLVVLGRVYARTIVAKQAGLDDAMIVLSGVLSVIFCITIYKQTEFGMGKHAWQFPHEDKAVIVLWFWASIWIYYLCLGLTKLSILIQYLRIFPQVNFRRMCYAMICIIIVWTLWATLSAIFTCLPAQVFWTSAEYFDDPRCMPRSVIWYSNAGINIITDCAIALLPMKVIQSLEMPRRQRNLLYVLFGIGFVTCFLSLLRLIYIYPMAVNPDITWHSPLFCIWSAVELNIAIVCSSIPALKNFVKRVWPSILQFFSSTKDAARSGTGASDSAATAINSASTIYSTKGSALKGSHMAYIEAQMMKAPKRSAVVRVLGLFGRNNGRGRLGSDVALDDDITHLRWDSTSRPVLHTASRSIEVQTAVKQTIDIESADQGSGGK